MTSARSSTFTFYAPQSSSKRRMKSPTGLPMGPDARPLDSSDIGYYDTGYAKNQIWFTGAGGDIFHSKHLDWEQELYVSQEAGPESTNKRSLWVWPVFDARFRTCVPAAAAASPG